MYLAELAAGVNARVLGDRYAYIQVEKAFTARSLSPPLLALGAAALQIAKDARDRYSFWTTEYPRITYRLLQSVSMKESTLPRLVLVGGGMLAQSLLASVNAAHYRSIYVITRNPERLSYTLEDKQYSILSPRNLSQLNWLDGTFQCLIATEGIDDPYRAGLASLVEKPGCEVTMDLSTIPVFLGTPPTSTLYLTIYDSNVQQELEFVNSTLTETARTVARDIARATWTLLPAHAPRLPRDPSLYSLSTWT